MSSSTNTNTDTRPVDEHDNPIQLPHNCKCSHEVWVTQPWPICNNYEPAHKYMPERGAECAHCEHDEECH
jgi:hypothetical protein